MFYLFENPENLASIIYDGNTLSDEEKVQAVKIESLPEKPKGTAVLKVSKVENRVWYEVVEADETVPASVAALLQQSMSELTLYIAAQDEQIQLQNQAISELTMLIAETNGGNA